MTTPTTHKKLHLLQITHDLDFGGLQQVIYNICRTIDRDQFEVSVLCLRAKGCFTEDVEALGIPVYCIAPPSGSTDYFLFLKVAKLLRKLKIDVVHTHNTQPFIDGTLGALLAGTKTIVHTDHARDFPDKTRYMIAEWFMSQFAYRVVGCSEHTSENLHKFEKISKQKIVTIENGIDPSRFNISIDTDAKRLALGINQSGPIIGLAVRHSKQKGICYLLDAMPFVISKIPNITLLIAGSGELTETLKSQAQRLGLNENVKFIGPRLDIPELLQLFDLYVLPSLWEGLPMVILEAMAAGCPVLATDVGGNYKAIENGVNGCLVEASCSESLAHNIVELLTDPKTLTQYREQSFEKFNKHYSAHIMTSRYMRLYQRQD
ncbi:glycosyltransferase [Oceanicoccus sp. KOV_DT_Chl]|uniref:glycosyltransferase n=1 Tax=Oceanicoccus sp. KOV_DT_Chl TaxID=1904639 RepID=UPI00135802E2|nr:glycosyltransferase [Oceanicoccus sp. KOV_DT_Chl]